METFTLVMNRKLVRKLIDLIPDGDEWEQLVSALDEAQGNAGDDGTADIEITVRGEPL